MRGPLFFALACIAALFPKNGNPQSLNPLPTRSGFSTILVAQKEVSVVRALAGRVVVAGTDIPASGITVDLCSSDWKTIVTSTKTDENGYFSLGSQPTKKLLYVRLSSPGMEIYQLRVRINRHAPPELKIRMTVAT